MTAGGQLHQKKKIPTRKYCHEGLIDQSQKRFQAKSNPAPKYFKVFHSLQKIWPIRYWVILYFIILIVMLK